MIGRARRAVGGRGMRGRGDTATRGRGDLGFGADGNCASLCTVGRICAGEAGSAFLAEQCQFRIRLLFLLCWGPFAGFPIWLVGFPERGRSGGSLPASIAPPYLQCNTGAGGEGGAKAARA